VVILASPNALKRQVRPTCQGVFDRIIRDIQRTGDGADTLPAYIMSPASLADGFNENTPG
jgi:hypothetical protein